MSHSEIVKAMKMFSEGYGWEDVKVSLGLTKHRAKQLMLAYRRHLYMKKAQR